MCNVTKFQKFIYDDTNYLSNKLHIVLILRKMGSPVTKSLEDHYWP